jgi:chitinase
MTIPIIGYLSHWSIADYAADDHVDYTKLDYIIFDCLTVTGAADPTLEVESADGTIANQLNNLVTKAKAANPSIKVLASLFGTSSEAESVIEDVDMRTTLVSNLATIVTTYSLDGLDLDVESATLATATYETFITAVRTAIGGSKILTAANAPLEFWSETGYYFSSTVEAQLDYVNVMAYDFYYGDTLLILKNQEVLIKHYIRMSLIV